MGTMGRASCPPMAGTRTPGHVTLEVAAANAPRVPDLQAGQVPAGKKVIDRAATDVQKPGRPLSPSAGVLPKSRDSSRLLWSLHREELDVPGGRFVRMHRLTSGLLVEEGLAGTCPENSFYRTYVLESRTKLSTAYTFGVMLFVTPAPPGIPDLGGLPQTKRPPQDPACGGLIRRSKRPGECLRPRCCVGKEPLLADELGMAQGSSRLVSVTTSSGWRRK